MLKTFATVLETVSNILWPSNTAASLDLRSGDGFEIRHNFTLPDLCACFSDEKQIFCPKNVVLFRTAASKAGWRSRTCSASITQTSPSLHGAMAVPHTSRSRSYGQLPSCQFRRGVAGCTARACSMTVKMRVNEQRQFSPADLPSKNALCIPKNSGRQNQKFLFFNNLYCY